MVSAAESRRVLESMSSWPIVIDGSISTSLINSLQIISGGGCWTVDCLAGSVAGWFEGCAAGAGCDTWVVDGAETVTLLDCVAVADWLLNRPAVLFCCVLLLKILGAAALCVLPALLLNMLGVVWVWVCGCACCWAVIALLNTLVVWLAGCPWLLNILLLAVPFGTVLLNRLGVVDWVCCVGCTGWAGWVVVANGLTDGPVFSWAGLGIILLVKVDWVCCGLLKVLGWFCWGCCPWLLLKIFGVGCWELLNKLGVWGLLLYGLAACWLFCPMVLGPGLVNMLDAVLFELPNVFVLGEGCPKRLTIGFWVAVVALFSGKFEGAVLLLLNMLFMRQNKSQINILATQDSFIFYLLISIRMFSTLLLLLVCSRAATSSDQNAKQCSDDQNTFWFDTGCWPIAPNTYKNNNGSLECTLNSQLINGNCILSGHS